MRLTNAIREEMVEAIMRDTPDGRVAIEEEFCEHALKWYLDRLPNDAARELFNTHPELFQTRRASVGHLYYQYGSGAKTVEVPSNDYDSPHRETEWYEPLDKKWHEANKARKDAQTEVEQALKSVTTAKRLKEVYPELAKYLPNDISGQALAVPQALPNLHKAGWPKEKVDETRE